jgi:hypothetical protein
MSTSVFTLRELFAELPDTSFADYRAFERVLIDRFNDHVLDFPPGYRWSDALDWGVRNNIVRRKGDQIVVNTSER